MSADMVLLTLAVTACMLTGVLLVEVLAAMPLRSVTGACNVRRPRVGVLVPAHNEAAGIAGTLRSVFPQLETGDRLIVVADNCSDSTAQVASQAGAEVTERRDPARRGKGYALHHGIRFVERGHASPEVLIIIDADCEVTTGTIDRIAELAMASGRPVQATYLMKAPETATALAAVAEFAWILKNKVRPLGALRLGMPCHLTGSGMAFPWEMVRSLRIDGGHLVEDMKMGLDLARAGTAPLFCPEALVLSSFPNNEEGATTQHKRWVHGHLGMIAAEAPRLLIQGLAGRAGSGVLFLAVDLCIPPLTLLASMIAVLFVLCALHAMIAELFAPLLVIALALAMFAIAVGASWLRFGREALPSSQLVHALCYAWRRLPVYAQYLINRQVAWIRSKRDSDI